MSLHQGVFIIEGKKLLGDDPRLSKLVPREVHLQCSCEELDLVVKVPARQNALIEAKAELARHQQSQE